MSGIQVKNGKAFEYSCLNSLNIFLSENQKIIIENNKEFETAKEYFENLSKDIQRNLKKASNAFVKIIINLEPQLLYPNINNPLIISLQKDKLGKIGDVRDILCLKKESGWEIGLSCKHNHKAIKHSRLSNNIDFGKEWFKIPCSENYFQEIKPIFEELKDIKENSNKKHCGMI